MTITMKQIENILQTLPIGYYCGRKIDVRLEEQTPNGCSYYCPADDNIVVCGNQVLKGLKDVELTEDYTLETAVRSMLYHEVSHAILTPNDLTANDYINIMEDERIETMLKDYYLDTNFEQQLANISGKHLNIDTKNSMEMYFNAVRFGIGKKSWVDRVERIIDEYQDIDGTTTDYWRISCYERDIRDLYLTIRKDIQNNDQDIPSQSDLEQQLKDKLEQMKSEGNGSGQNEEEKRNNGRANSSNNSNNTNEQNNGDATNSENEGTGIGEQNETGQGGKGCGIGDRIKQIVENMTSQYRDENMRKALEPIFNSFHKKNNSGNSVVAHSGVINPRNFVRNDYKYFDKKIAVNGNNKYGTCHLNLYIDNSGSFEDNAEVVNKMLRELTEIEKRNDNFTFDLIKCGSGMTETTKTTRFIEANEGTRLDMKQTEEVVNRHKKSNTLCYNIVLYDGECWGNPSDYNPKGYVHPFKYFDTANTTMILEHENKGIVERCGMRSANIIYENKDYTGKLFDNILKVLNVAFR